MNSMFRRIVPFVAVFFLLAVAERAVSAGGAPVLIGMVKASPDEAPEAATLKVGDVVYKIVRDKNGSTVAREADGKKVEVKGSVKTRDGVKWIAVTSCMIVE